MSFGDVLLYLESKHQLNSVAYQVGIKEQAPDCGRPFSRSSDTLVK